MLTILNHQKQQGVSARQLHNELQPRAGFVAWFRHYKKSFKENEEVFLLSPFVDGESGRRVYRTGDYLLTLPAAQDIAKRSGSQLSEKVRAKLHALAGKTPPAQEPATAPIIVENPVISLPTSLNEADSIVAMALRIQELTQQERKLSELCQNLREQHQEVQLELLMAKTDLRDLVMV